MCAARTSRSTHDAAIGSRDVAAPRTLLRILATMLAAASLAGASAEASSPFDGTWVADLSSQGGLPVDDYLVSDGTYACRSCSPPRSYPADGKPHAIPGDADVTSESVTVAGPRAIVTHIVSPAMTRSTTMTVSPDGWTATYISIDHRPGVKGPLRTEYLAKRIAPAPAGAHPVSGKWQGLRYVSVPVQLRTTELHIVGNSLTYRVPIGVSYTARFDGDFVPVSGPYRGKVTAAVVRRGDRQIVETRKEDAKVIATRTFTLLPDGNSLEIATTAAGSPSTFRVIAHRQ